MEGCKTTTELDRNSEETELNDEQEGSALTLKPENESPDASFTHSDSEEFVDATDAIYVPNVHSDEVCDKEEVVMKVPKIKWELMKGKFQIIDKCKLTYDNDKEVLLITGTGKDVAAKKDNVTALLESIVKISFPLSPEQDNFLKKINSQCLLDVISSVGIENAAYDFTVPSINLYCIGDMENRVEVLKTRLSETCSITVPSCVPKSKLRECENHFNNKAPTITVSYDEVQSKLILTGLTKDVTSVSKDIRKMLAEYNYTRDTFTLDGKYAVYLNAYGRGLLKEKLRDADIIEEIYQPEKISVSYKCHQVHKKKIKDDLTILRKNIMIKKLALNNFDEDELELITTNLKSDVHLLHDFQSANSCCVFVDHKENIKESTNPKEDAESSPNLESMNVTNLDHEDLVMNEHPQDLYSSGQSKLLTFGICKIQILPDGDIIGENSDLLVCGLHDSLNMMKMRVSTAFKKKDKSLQYDIKTSNFSQNGVLVIERNLHGSSCRAIAFVVLETWYQGMSDQKLIAAVTEILVKANEMGMKSVSIPPLTNRYPNNMVARALACAIHTYLKINPGSLSNIQMITLLLPDRLLFAEMVKEITNTEMNGATDDNDNQRSDDKMGATMVVAKGLSRFMKGVFNFAQHSIRRIVSRSLKKSLVITIVHGGQEGISLKLKKEMVKQWLYEDNFRPGEAFEWSSRFKDFMTETAVALHVKVKEVNDPRTAHSMCKIKGRPSDVSKMKDMMLQKVLEMGQETKSLLSPEAPGRGTLEFIDHSIKCDNHFPSYWTTKWDVFENSFIGSSNSGVSQQQVLLHSVDSRVFKAVERLVLNTWDRNRVGAGYDAAFIPSRSNVKVISVQRVENPTLYSSYFAKRLSILRDVKRRGRLCTDVQNLRNSKGPLQTMLNLDENMKKELLYEVNEQYLFHGTKKRTVKQIYDQGIDCRLSNPEAMFGQGVYTTESSTKADQYTDDRQNRLPNGSNLTMFLTRVILGDIFLCDDSHKSVQSKTSTKLKRPPCLSCLEDVCTDNCPGTGQFYHSVMGDGKWLFREFIVYSSDQCYPEYLIQYQRV